MNYLELCKRVARESGTMSGTNPASVASQTGRNLKVVQWVAEAWRQIQNLHGSWRWMRGEFSASLSASTNRYTAASFSLSRFAEWIVEEHERNDLMTVYKTSEGASDEGVLTWLDWHDYRRMYERGSQTNDRPVHWTVSPANELCVGPAPDATYTIRGEYRKSPQALEKNDDEPEMPARFHEIIAWKALMLLQEHDEAEWATAVASRRYGNDLDALQRDQLPPVTANPEPLA